MPVPPPRNREIHAALTEQAKGLHTAAYVEIIDHVACLQLHGARFPLGRTPREAKVALQEKVNWFKGALATARPGAE